MRAIFRPFVVLLAMCGAAAAQTPQEQAYVAAREQMAGDLEAKHRSLDGSRWHREEARAQEALTARLWGVIGATPPPPKGFAIDRANPDPLCCGPGAGALDALVISDGRNRAVMTTVGLMRLWLKRDPKAALQDNDIDYARALNADAAIEVFAPLPVQAPARTDLAVARLVVKGQGVARFPLHVVAAVVKGGRVLLTMRPASLEVADAGSPCERLWAESTERYRTADDLDKRRSIAADGARQLEHCTQFPGLGRRAQRLVDALAAD